MSGNSLFLAARASHVKGGFQLAARGGPTAQMYVDDAGVTRGSTDTFKTDRPQNNVSVDGNSFRGKHELKFGFGWRKATVDSSDVYPGNGVISYHQGYPDILAKITRPNRTLTDTIYTSAYGGDTWSMDRLTLNLGVRWDYESDMMNNDWVTPDSIRTAVSAWRATLACDGTQAVREQLCDASPYLTNGKERKPFYGAWQPRVGLSYDAFGTGKTVLFGGYGLYYDRNRYGNALSEMANLRWTTYTFRFFAEWRHGGWQPNDRVEPELLLAHRPSGDSRDGRCSASRAVPHQECDGATQGASV